MQTAGLVLPCGAQAPLLAGQRRLSCPKVSHGARSVVFSARVPAKAPRSRSHRTAAVSVTASTASSNGNLLPWQAAMDDVKKRQDIKSIMIIGAGPIVIGQVRHLRVQEPAPVANQDLLLLLSRTNLGFDREKPIWLLLAACLVLLRPI